MRILVLNAGSSTQKSRLYALTGDDRLEHAAAPVWEGHIDWSGPGGARLSARAGGSHIEQRLEEGGDRSVGLRRLLATLFEGETRVLRGPEQIDAVGHRIVHGGAEYTEATPIDAAVRDHIEALVPLAPAHNPAHLDGIDTVTELFGDVPQVAVFDTAFHRHMPEAAAVYPIPYEWYRRGVRRYGFHGISHRYAAERTAQLLDRPLEQLRLITCHLGNGCSLAAVKDGRSVDTTMGFSPLEGLMMGSRSGTIDPAIPVYLMREHGYDYEGIDRLLNRESGLKGVSGISGDMRELLAAEDDGDERARLALAVYIHRLRRYIGAMLPALGGLDALVFTGGVGEHAATVRERACAGLEFAGLELAPEKNRNAGPDQDLSALASRAAVFVVTAEEDWAIALTTRDRMQS